MKKTLSLLASATALVCAAQMAQAEISVFDWSGYDDPGFFGSFVEKYGKNPNYAFYANDQEGYNKIRAGFQADLAHPCLGIMPKMVASGMIKPIDTSKIAAWDDLLPTLRSLSDVTDKDGKVWMLPFDWGNTGLIYRTDKFTPDQISLQMLADPSMMGKVSLPSGVEDAYTLAALSMGMTDWTGMTDEQFQQASEFLRKVHKNVLFYWSDQGQLDAAIKSGEIEAAWAWNATELALKAENIPVQLVRDPNVGVSSWACGYVHLTNGTGSEEEVYDYLNALADAESGKYLIESWGYAHSNAKAYTMADQEAVTAYGYQDVENFLGTSLFGVSLSNDLSAKMLAEYEKIKAGF